jgi:M6 family metalloprotease-like protein
MTKRFFATIALGLVTLSAIAVPAKRGLWRTLTLANGTEVKAMLVGDEFGHFWKTEDGISYCKTANGYEVIEPQTVIKKAKARRSMANSKRAMRLPLNGVQKEKAGFFGVKKGLIILVNFSDLAFGSAHDNALYKRIANEKNFSEGNFKGSMCDYFLAQSLGQFELDFDVVGPYTVSKEYSYYGENDSEDNDKRPAEMVIEAVNMAKADVTDWNQYDWDNDGEVDQVYFVYAGYGEADSGQENTIWPHAYDLESAKFYGEGTGRVKVANNLYVSTYACGAELNGYGKISGIGTMCHEFSHCLGYPDFYDIDYSGGYGMDAWDLMDQGSYNGDGFTPAGYTSYERWVAGWAEPTVLETEDVNVDNMKSLQSSGESYVIYNKKNRNEYYLLENRQFDGWDAELPGNGLLIIHVDYDKSVWEENQPNDDPKHQRMQWVAADNNYQYKMYEGTKYLTWEGLAKDPFPYNNNKAFNRDTKPAAKLFNTNIDGTKYLTSSVENITRNDDYTISFNFISEYQGGSNTDDTTKVNIEGALFYESFDKCNGKGANDGNWSTSVASSTFLPDNEGWSAASLYGAYKCARFGSSKKTGTATSPQISLTGNTSTISFKAAGWGTDNTGLRLSATGATVTIEPSEFTMINGEWTTFTATISGTGNINLVFTPGKRFYLDEVVVVDNAVQTGITSTEATNHKQPRIYTLDGRYAGSDVNALKHGLYIINGKKVVK